MQHLIEFNKMKIQTQSNKKQTSIVIVGYRNQNDDAVNAEKGTNFHL